MTGIFGAIGNVASSIINGAFNNSAAQYNAQQNLKFDLISRARDWRDYKNYYERYYSPTAQMAAFEKAGLNPNLIYGNMSGIQSPQERNISAPGMQPNSIDLDLSAMDNAFYRLRQDKRAEQYNAAAIANLQANAANTNARTANETFKATLLGQQKVLNDLRIDYENSTNPLKKNHLLKQINLLEEQIRTQVWQRQLQDNRLDFDVQRFNEGVRQFNAMYKLKRLQSPLTLFEDITGITPQGAYQSAKEYWRSKVLKQNEGGASRGY